MTKRIREMVILNQDTSVDEICAKLQRENIPVAEERKPSVATLRYETLRTLNLAKQLGWQPPA